MVESSSSSSSSSSSHGRKRRRTEEYHSNNNTNHHHHHHHHPDHTNRRRPKSLWWPSRPTNCHEYPQQDHDSLNLPIIILRTTTKKKRHHARFPRSRRFILGYWWRWYSTFFVIFGLFGLPVVVRSEEVHDDDDAAAAAYYNPNAAVTSSSNDDTTTTTTMTSTQILNPVVTSDYDCGSSSTSRRSRHRHAPGVSVSLLSIVCDTPGAYYSGSNAYRNSHVCVGGDKAKMDLLCTFSLFVYVCLYLSVCMLDIWCAPHIYGNIPAVISLTLVLLWYVRPIFSLFVSSSNTHGIATTLYCYLQ